jgi:hypothetical protein
MASRTDPKAPARTGPVPGVWSDGVRRPGRTPHSARSGGKQLGRHRHRRALRSAVPRPARAPPLPGRSLIGPVEVRGFLAGGREAVMRAAGAPRPEGPLSVEFDTTLSLSLPPTVSLPRGR